MAPQLVDSEETQAIEVPPSLISWKQILHSWFWRLYDHLGILVLCNALWFSGLMVLGLFFNKMGWIGSFQNPQLPGCLILYLLSSYYSVGWSYSVFRIFTGQEFKLKNYWEGSRLFFLRAVFLSALWSGVALLSYWNFRIFPSIVKEWGVAGYILEGLSFWVILFLLSSALFQWSLLFSQNISAFRTIKKSFLIVLGNSLLSLGLLTGLLTVLFFFTIFFVVGWALMGLVLMVSLPIVALEKILLKYNITLLNQSLLPLLEELEVERKRGWRELLKPWEYR